MGKYPIHTHTHLGIFHFFFHERCLKEVQNLTLQIQDVYETTYETCGQYWPYIHHYILLAIILMQITMIGLFGLKLKPAASISTIPLITFTLMFNHYCKMRFLPSFHHYSLLVSYYL